MKEMTCIVCPNGCRMSVELQDGLWKVEGNLCARGREFAINEMINPKRTVCSTVRTSYREMPRLPVRTDKEIPKDYIFAVMNEIGKIRIDHRVYNGEVIIENILGTGADIIATSDMHLYVKGDEQ